jgi:metal-responsive CopG/Arc/MetJ family transcriptional regulator
VRILKKNFCLSLEEELVKKFREEFLKKEGQSFSDFVNGVIEDLLNQREVKRRG